jgi:septum site-determining protein MinD
MTKIIVVTSGKGGVGKTTTSASFSAGLALRGHKTAVIDFDVGLRNLDLIMGCERRVVYDLINVIHGEANLNQALIKDKQCDNLFVLAASQTRDKDALTQDGVEKVLTDLAAMGFEYIVCDSPAGIETGALMAMHFADEALVVTNPEVSSVRDSDRILGMLGSKTRRAIEGREPIKEHLLITRYNPNRVQEGQMLSLEDIQGHPAHQADRRDPRERERAASVQPGRAGGAHGRQRCVRGLQGRDRPLPGRRQTPAFHRRGKTRPAQAPVREEVSMSFLSFLLGEKKKTASVAKERLQIILAHERSGRNAAEPDYLPALQRDLVAVISKYIKINPEDIKVNLERQDNLEVLEVKIELPDAR